MSSHQKPTWLDRYGMFLVALFGICCILLLVFWHPTWGQ
jgi:hypothetical protein